MLLIKKNQRLCYCCEVQQRKKGADASVGAMEAFQLIWFPTGGRKFVLAVDKSQRCNIIFNTVFWIFNCVILRIAVNNPLLIQLYQVITFRAKKRLYEFQINDARNKAEQKNCWK